MLHSKYSMDIISHHSSFKNKNLKKYNVDGIETVGAWGMSHLKLDLKITVTIKFR